VLGGVVTRGLQHQRDRRSARRDCTRVGVLRFRRDGVEAPSGGPLQCGGGSGALEGAELRWPLQSIARRMEHPL
jgi:hypothetical protein